MVKNIQNLTGKKIHRFWPWKSRVVTVWGVIFIASDFHASLKKRNVFLEENISNWCTVRKMTYPFITINHFGTKRIFSYPQESDNTILFLMLVLVLFTLFIGAIRMHFNQFNQEEMNLDILSKLLILSLSLLHQNQNKSVDWYEFVTNSTFSVNIASFK